MSFISSIFTPQGTSARQGEENRQSSAESYLSGLLPAEAQYGQSLQTFRNGQLPNMEQGVQNAYYDTTQGGRNGEAQAYADQQNAQGDQASAAANSKFAGNPNLAQGYKLDASNQANTNTANYASQLNSPQGENSAWANYLAANSTLAPNYGGAESLTGAINGQPTVQVGQGLGNFLGSALGTWATGGYGSLSNGIGNLVGWSGPSAANVGSTQGGLTI